MLIPVDRWSLTLKKVGSEVFLQNQSINSFIPTSRMNLLCPIIKRKGFIMWIHVSSNWKTNFNSKKGTKRSFFYETKASIHFSFIPMSKMNLCCPIIKKKETFMCFNVYPNWNTDINFKKCRKKKFSFEIEAPIHLS